MNATDPKPTIVLVHGAFADASSWNGVIERLQQQGYTVIASANPLRGVAAASPARCSGPAIPDCHHEPSGRASACPWLD